MNELLQIKVQSLFKHYTSTALISNKSTVFNLFKPPKPIDYYINITNNSSLIDKFLTLIKDQLYDEHSLMSFNQFININAFLLRKGKKSSVFFIKFSETGNTGKNNIDNAFSKLYNEFAFTGITELQMTEKHNGGFVNKLYRSYDEFENSNYKTKYVNNIIKRITNPRLAARSMNEDTKQTDDYAIDVLNSNDPGLYGLTKADAALKSRLCIIRLKERSIRLSKYSKYINVVDQPEFPYSLYQYLMNVDLTDFINNNEFDRYPLSRTELIIKQLN